MTNPPETPSPQSYPIIGNLLSFLHNRHRFHDWVTDMLSQTPTSTLRVCTFLNLSHGICTANPTNVQHLLYTNFPNYIKGSRFHNVLCELLGDGIFNVDGHLWTVQRKIASHEFNTKSLKNFVADTVKSEISNRLLPYLSAASLADEQFDLQAVLQRFTFANILNVAFGVDPSRLDTENSEFGKAFDLAVETTSSRFLSPVPLIWKFKRFCEIGSEKKFKDAIKVIDNYAMKIIESREDQENEIVNNSDLLSRFMSNDAVQFQDHDQKRKFLRDIVISFVLAGRDSTSTALTWFFWLIAARPRMAELIYKELLSVATAAAAEEGIVFGYDELKKLHYLHAALSESLRLFPPVPINSRLTVDDDVLPDGTHVGKGWFADYSAYAMGRMEKVWGPDCKEFKPERWLNDEGVYQPLDPFRYPVFHSGPRICLGKEMAFVQMKSVAAAVLYEYELVAADGGGTAEKMMDPPYMLTLLLRMRGGFLVRLKKRRCGPPET
ncbi:putative Cytochrome P450 [Quillaja saponaria]|uniref:Cytochrome P450 n=1 Tax=Quillaja saponaria TaxID=32244 RepID=A0AAD7PMX6_QUISA|nr:putative Cytochrome P450 [Quillaja saponaria]